MNRERSGGDTVAAGIWNKEKENFSRGKGISRKIFLQLEKPTEEDSRSYQQRILDGLKGKNIDSRMTIRTMGKLYPLCDQAEWEITVSLAWDGVQWWIVDAEAGDTTAFHYGYAVDMGSTTVAVQLWNCETGECLWEADSYSRQISYGTDILTRIFYCKDDPDKRKELQKASIDTILDILKEIEKNTGIGPEQCIQMVIAGNTTMIHFLLDMDAFCVFSTPYAVRADCPGFFGGTELGIPVKGFLYCYPGKSNYLGGDIISGVAAMGLHKSEEIQVFFDIGTNGEIVIGNKEFLLCGAGAAGPALEGGSVRTGMRACEGAVDRVTIQDGKVCCHVIGGETAKGICGSGIIELLSELFLHGWINFLGKLQPEKSSLIRTMDGLPALEYAPGLYFWQEDIDEFIKTKAAASTMVEYMFRESGLSLDKVSRFYVAGAFGKHVNKEAAITIGMYQDMDRERLVSAGNASLAGAGMLLMDKSMLNDLDEILDKMVYIQFGAVEDFLHMMVAAQAIPHTDMERYPTVRKKLAEIEEKNKGA